MMINKALLVWTNQSRFDKIPKVFLPTNDKTSEQKNLGNQYNLRPNDLSFPALLWLQIVDLQMTATEKVSAISKIYNITASAVYK